MPTEYKVYPQMLKTIESIQKSMKRSTFQSLSDDDKRSLYASVFGARFAANAERNKKSTLKGTVSVQEFEQKRNALIQCPTFQTFINRTVENDPDGMKRTAETYLNGKDSNREYAPYTQNRIDAVKVVKDCGEKGAAFSEEEIQTVDRNQHRAQEAINRRFGDVLEAENYEEPKKEEPQLPNPMN